MRIFYLVAAYNESKVLESLASQLKAVPQKYPGSQLIIVDNGSTDDSKKVLEKIQKKYQWCKVFFETEKGMGIAFRRGMRELRKLNLSKNDWIAFNAADLPFGFFDLVQFLERQATHPECALFVGSKSHPESRVKRSWKRHLASWCFYLVRFLVLGMKTKDPQGTLFLRADFLYLVDQIEAKDYFFTTELVYQMEKHTHVIEMPVILAKEVRVSKIRILEDGMKAFKQTVALRTRKD